MSKVTRARKRDQQIIELTRKLDDDYQNYSDSVLILSGLASHFKSSKEPIRFIATNLPMKRLKTPEKQPPRPDLVLQATDNSCGFCFELKWSLPYEEEQLKSSLLPCKRYSEQRTGWNTHDGTIPSVNAFVVVPRDHCKKIQELINKDQDIKFLFSKDVTLLSWDFSRTTSKERLYVLKVAGASSPIDKLFLAPGLELDKTILTETYAKFNFYGAKPPLHYAMEKVYFLANSLKAFDVLTDVEVKSRTTRYLREGILVTARELDAEQTTFFPPWERADQELPQIRLGWIQEALVGLAQINMAIPVMAYRKISKSGTIFIRRKIGWQNDRSQQFFIPGRLRGVDMRYHIIQKYARRILSRKAV